MLKWTINRRGDTMAHNRRSMGALQDPSTPHDSRRRSLGSAAISRRTSLLNDKENQYTPNTHLRVNSENSIKSDAFRDVSNITPSSTPIQHSASTPQSSNRKRRLQRSPISVVRNSQYASTLPSFDLEYSPCGIKAGPFLALRHIGIADSYYENPRYINDEDLPSAKRVKKSPEMTPLSRRLSDIRFSRMSFKRPTAISKFNPTQEETLSSSAMGDVTLDIMIDAILESAKKDKIAVRRSLRKDEKTILEESISPTYAAADDPASDLNKFCDQFMLSPETFLAAGERTIIISDPSRLNEREVKTPEKSHDVSMRLEGACQLRRQKAVRRKNKQDDHPKPKCLIGLTLPNGIPSPETPENMYHMNSIMRKSLDVLADLDTPQPVARIVLNCESENEADKNESTPDIELKHLRASSTPTGCTMSPRRCLNFSPELGEDSMGKRSSVASSTTSRCSRTNFVRGSLDLAIFVECNKTFVHVIRCRDLQRSGGGSINAYVKLALLPAEGSGNENGFQRTAVHRNSAKPYFDQRFTFDLVDDDQPKRLQLAVWHRDRELKRSEFMGCMSFQIINVLKKEINGSYKLQPQTCLTTPTPPIAMGENSQSSVEDVMSIDESAIITGSAEHGSHSTIPLSKKAIHQRDADENLFLRFLELDPPPDTEKPDTKNTSTGNKDEGNKKETKESKEAALRRQSAAPPTSRTSAGRTPFTITKNLRRPADKGFGFSIVWTHPPRVEKVEPNMPADKAGIWPGDYVIFVDKHNIVTMPEMDILNLIRSHGINLTLEIFRRTSSTPRPTNGIRTRLPSLTSQTLPEPQPVVVVPPPRPSTACSNLSVSIETSKRRLHLPQVTFSKESILPHSADDQRRKFLYQLINREQNFVTALQFGMQRFVTPLQERKDLISPNDHRTLFQNIDELLRIAEDILEQLVQDDQEPHIHYTSRVYLSKTTAICAAYKKYCNGLKRADCVLVNKSRYPNSEFVAFISEPQVPRKRPDLTTFIHRPLQHFREILKLIQMIASHCRVDSEEFKHLTNVVQELQAAYREITVGGGLMEPLGEGRPLLTLQDLESRLVFTRCKPFVLAAPGRQWIFGGDLSRVEGRSVKPYWTLLFSDILLFAKVSRDRVLFITEEPLPLANITDSCFNVRKKCAKISATEFRITIDPNGRMAESPTVHCAPDLTRTPRKNARRRSIILRAPSPELKAVWQNLLQRQIFLVNAALGSTPLSSPLDSPDVIHTLVPLSDIGAATTSMASIKLSVDSIPMKNQQSCRSSDVSRKIDEIIDEKCRILNKTGTQKGSALHLAQWMKGQLDKSVSEFYRQEEHHEEEMVNEPDEEQIIEWSREQLQRRSKELQLVDENGTHMKVVPLRCDSRIEEMSISEAEDGSKSPSRSTTSDSQITVRSSPIANTDKISVCRSCHKNCKQTLGQPLNSSLKVQHSQASPSGRCCQKSVSSSLNSTSSSHRTAHTSSSMTLNCNQNGSLASISSKEIPLKPARKTNGITATAEVSMKTTRKALHDVDASSVNSNASTCYCKCKEMNKSNNEKAIPNHMQEIRKETCRLLNDVSEITPRKILQNIGTMDLHKHCKCTCGNTTIEIKEETEDDNDDWSLMLIGLAQIHPTTSLVHIDPFEAVPTISVVPPTPDALSKQSTMNSFDCTKLTLEDIEKGIIDDNSQEVSPEDSPQDEEPPYRALNTGLRRYGTLSSLERVPSEDEKTLNSSEEEYEDEDDSDIKIITKEVYTNSQSLRNWTARAGNYVAEKIALLEQSRAFLDSYLGRWDRNSEQDGTCEDETLDECTSGATSGEEIWGTPTSGGENDEMQMFNSDQTHSSPTKSSSSLTGDEDTELMMDELLMAPPMTASTIRGLLPRRRLEPLFEEDTETTDSDEEDKLPPDASSSDQGQAMENYHKANGRILRAPRDSESEESEEEEATEEEKRGNQRIQNIRTEFGILNQRKVIVLEDQESTEEDDGTITPREYSEVVPQSINMQKPLKMKTKITTMSRSCSTMQMMTKIMMPNTTVLHAGTVDTETKYGQNADVCLAPAHQQEAVNISVNGIDTAEARLSTTSTAPALQRSKPINHSDEPHPIQTPTRSDAGSPNGGVGGGSNTDRLSPRLEMRLALNNDILGDEDLIGYAPGPDYATILGQDLSAFHRLTGREILSRTGSHRIVPKEAQIISLSQQRNSKIDTPTPNRKKTNLNTWSSSASVVVDVESVANSWSNTPATIIQPATPLQRQLQPPNSGAAVDVTGNRKLTDLERLARQEKMYCMSQSRNSPVAARYTNHTRRSIQDDGQISKTSKFFSFLKRRNSDNHLASSKDSSEDAPSSNEKLFSPRKETDKPLDRRFWKQLSRRRRSLSISELEAC